MLIQKFYEIRETGIREGKKRGKKIFSHFTRHTSVDCHNFDNCPLKMTNNYFPINQIQGCYPLVIILFGGYVRRKGYGDKSCTSYVVD